MLPDAASTGISLMGDMPWGTHFCYFFETKQDLLDASVPFLRAGLEHHEFCLWIVCPPLTEADSLRTLRESIPNIDRYLAEGGMEILVHGQPITPGDSQTARGRVHQLQEKLADALARGYAGMRVAGSPASMQKKDMGVFRDFERELSESVANRRMIALCQFPLADSSAAEILDAARTHQFVVSRRHGDWEIIETPEIKLTKTEIIQLNQQLERRVEERALALEAANQELRTEIARRERVEEDLRRQKEILQTVFDHIPIMISFIEGSGEFKLVNREWERTLGRSIEEMRSQKIDIVAENYPDPELRQKVEDFYRRSQGEWGDFKTTVPDGRVIDVSWAVLHLSDGTAVCFGQDITRRKRMEEALRESEERFRQLAENIGDLFWIKTPDLKRVIYFSPSYDSISGRSREDAYRNPDYQGFLKRVVAEDRARLTQFMERPVEKEYEIEYRITHPDGSVHWASERGFPIRDQSGQIYRVAGITRDITAGKLAEEALRESEQRFRQIAENIREVFWLRSPDLQQLLYVSPM
jgi:PAS domain S-box-containing protein